MTEYKIYPIEVGLIGVTKATMTFNLQPDLAFTVPILAFYIEGGDKKILVDTGCVDDPNYHGFTLAGVGPEGMRKGLAKVGLKPEDIDIVIISHFHFDHAANIGLFPNAQFILQKTEWEYAKNPIPIQDGVYVAELLRELEGYDLVLADDGYEVADGVNVICVPGHTMGQQATVVNTSEGKYVISGDLIYMQLNMYPDTTEFIDATGAKIEVIPQPGHAFYPPGIHVNLMDWYNSVWRVLKVAGSRKRILPGHDPFINGKVFPGK
ncbi:MAG: N-acyl homoserine lactonase family protein [Syntrophomonadaceae bacterium]|nr:N-acyl homoserine lactonase family protein [Syntrophomonadaceae bacterium]